MLANVCLLNNLIYLDSAIIDGMLGLFLIDEHVLKARFLDLRRMQVFHFGITKGKGTFIQADSDRIVVVNRGHV